MKFVAVAVLFSFLCASCASLDPYRSESDRIRQIVAQQHSQPINEYTIFRSPSYPQKISRVVNPLDPVEALVVALPYDDALSNYNMIAFYLTLIEQALAVTDVIVLVSERELFDFKSLLSQLAHTKLDRYLYGDARHHIRIVPARFNTKWIRDYGPIFLVDARGRLCVADAIYGDVRSEVDKTDFFSIKDFFKVDVLSIVGAEASDAEEETEPGQRYEDDAMSMYLIGHLYREHGYDIPIIRVPFQIQGGDIFADGLNNLFVSSETVQLNGGHRADLELILKSYYGMKTVTYLEPLPGDTVKHLDMIFMPIGSDRFLAADYPAEVPDTDVYMRYLHHETKAILDANAAKLRQKFPQRTIVRMPMPPVQRASKLDDALLALTGALFSARGYRPPPEMTSNPQNWDARKFVFFCEILKRYKKLKSENRAQELLQVLGPFAADEFSGEYEAVLNRCVGKLLENDPRLLGWLAAARRSESLPGRAEELSDAALLGDLVNAYLKEGTLEDPENYFYVYRSYLNATYINGSSGKLLLVPSYTGFQEIERKVAAIYRAQFPAAKIVFINSDEIIRQYGAIHCATITVPDFKAK